MFSSFLPPLVEDLDMFGIELSLGDREDFSRGKPGCSVAAVWRKTDLSLCTKREPGAPLPVFVSDGTFVELPGG